jgi:hypothetical protein
MNKDEIMDKIKGMIGDGKMDDAKEFIEDHKDDLGEYYDKAKDMIGSGLGDAVGKIKGIFGK